MIRNIPRKHWFVVSIVTIILGLVIGVGGGVAMSYMDDTGELAQPEGYIESDCSEDATVTVETNSRDTPGHYATVFPDSDGAPESFSHGTRFVATNTGSRTIEPRDKVLLVYIDEDQSKILDEHTVCPGE